MKIAAFDLEMANSFAYGSICWAGLAITDDSLSTVKTVDVRINPNVRKFHCGNNIHFPFTIKDLKEEPMLPEAYRDFSEYLDGSYLVVGHDIEQDILMFTAACRRNNIPCPEFSYIDSQLLYMLFRKEDQISGLHKCAEFFGIEYAEHDPVEDARASLEVIRHICMAENLTFPELLKAYHIELGELKHLCLKRIYSDLLPAPMRIRIQKMNSYFEQLVHPAPVREAGPFHKRFVCIEDGLLQRFNLIPIIRKLQENGATLTKFPRLADVIVTSKSEEKKQISLETLLKKMGLKDRVSKYRDRQFELGLALAQGKREALFHVAKEITPNPDAVNSPIYKKRISLSDELEQRNDFLEIVHHLADLGAQFTRVISKSDCFLLSDRALFDVEDLKDVKIAYIKRKKAEKKLRQKIMTIDELSNLVKRNKKQ